MNNNDALINPYWSAGRDFESFALRNNDTPEEPVNAGEATPDDLEQLELFINNINDLAEYGQAIFNSLKEKFSCLENNKKLKAKVEHFKEQNNLLIEEILEYINESQVLPGESNITDDMILEHASHKNHFKSPVAERLWEDICRIPLPEDLLREHLDTLITALGETAWFLISKHQVLSIEFLTEFRHKVYWEEISKQGYINEEYINTFKDELYWHILDKNLKITDELRKEFAYKFG